MAGIVVTRTDGTDDTFNNAKATAPDTWAFVHVWIVNDDQSLQINEQTLHRDRYDASWELDKTQQAGYYLPGQWTNVRNV